QVTTISGGYIHVGFTDYDSQTGGVTSFQGTDWRNKVWVKLEPVGNNLLKAGANGAIVLKPDTADGKVFSYTIDVGSALNVNADTYTISVRAHSWVE
ncbi:MAG: hypothetical protein ACRCUU_04170, partial [Plesiomonas sp.]